jgi:hypothetical protein
LRRQNCLPENPGIRPVRRRSNQQSAGTDPGIVFSRLIRIATRNVSPGWAFSVNTIGCSVSGSVRDTIAPFENTVTYEVIAIHGQVQP